MSPGSFRGEPSNAGQSPERASGSDRVRNVEAYREVLRAEVNRYQSLHAAVARLLESTVQPNDPLLSRLRQLLAQTEQVMRRAQEDFATYKQSIER